MAVEFAPPTRWAILVPIVGFVADQYLDGFPFTLYRIGDKNLPLNLFGVERGRMLVLGIIFTL